MGGVQEAGGSRLTILLPPIVMSKAPVRSDKFPVECRYLDARLDMPYDETPIIDPDQEWEARAVQKRQMLSELSRRPTVEVVGIVDPLGAMAGWSKGDERWSILVILAPWRDQHGVLHKEDLRIHKEIAQEESGAYRSAIPADSITRFRVRFNAEEDPVNALLVEILGPASGDEVLEAALADSLRPVFVDDEDLGRLVLNRQSDCFEGDLTRGASSIGISFYGEDADGQRTTLDVLRTVCKELTNLDATAREYAAGELLTLFNEEWRDDDEPEHSADDFTARMTLTDITASQNGDFDFWYDDGDLFCGHAIYVRGNLTHGFTDADIEG